MLMATNKFRNIQYYYQQKYRIFFSKKNYSSLMWMSRNCFCWRKKVLQFYVFEIFFCFQNVKIQKRAENISFSKSLQEPITFQHRDLSALKGKYQRFLEIRISENSFFLSFRWSGKLKRIFALKLKLSCRLNWDLMI